MQYQVYLEILGMHVSCTIPMIDVIGMNNEIVRVKKGTLPLKLVTISKVDEIMNMLVLCRRGTPFRPMASGWASHGTQSMYHASTTNLIRGWLPRSI